MKNILIITQKIDKNDDVLGFFNAWVSEFSKHFNKVLVVCLEKREYDLPNNVRIFSLGKENGHSRIKYLKKFYKYIFGLRKEYEEDKWTTSLIRMGSGLHDRSSDCSLSNWWRMAR